MGHYTILSLSPHTYLQCSYVIDVDVHVPWAPDIEVRQPLMIKPLSNTTVSNSHIPSDLGIRLWPSISQSYRPNYKVMLRGEEILMHSHLAHPSSFPSLPPQLQWTSWSPPTWVCECVQAPVTGLCAVPPNLLSKRNNSCL